MPERACLASRKALAIFTSKCLLWKLNYIWDFGLPLPQPHRGRFWKVTVVTVAIRGLSAFRLCTGRPHRLLQHPGPRGPCARGEGALCPCWGMGLLQRSLAQDPRPLPLLPPTPLLQHTLSHLQPLLDQQLSLNVKLKSDSWSGCVLFVCVCLFQNISENSS